MTIKFLMESINENLFNKISPVKYKENTGLIKSKLF